MDNQGEHRTPARPDRRRGGTCLPDDLADGLGRNLLDALDNRARRQILRVLNRDGGARAWSRSELIQAGEVGCSPACINYHSRVLVMCGVITKADAAGAAQHRYRSTVAADPRVVAVLSASEGFDSGPPAVAAPAS